MNISKLIKQLEQAQKTHGDLPVFLQSHRKFYVHTPMLKVEAPHPEADRRRRRRRLILEASSA